MRKTDQRIPESREARYSLKKAAADYVRENCLKPPASITELREYARLVLQGAGGNSDFVDFVALFVNNSIWLPTIARVPYDRRVLLLPQCLRNEEVCRADKDEFGLICAQCGGCCIGKIQDAAEKLGYIVLVAEGTTVVTGLLASGKIDAVLGVSCMDVLEKTFLFLVNGAIPGVALPLLKNGCVNTEVEEDWIMEAIAARNNEGFYPYLNIDEMKEEVRGWFDKDTLEHVTGRPLTLTEQVAFEWLAGFGKRWRPFLTASVYSALHGDSGEIPTEVRKVSVAIECFHKASLVHDDIADGDDNRYHMPTLHKKHGAPFALNVGDYLVGLGYRLLSGCGLTADKTMCLLKNVSAAHTELCLGQGAELDWATKREVISPEEVIKIFKSKTSPSFRAAILTGVICADGNDHMLDVMARFSDSLGVAYQISDDLEDFQNSDGGDSFSGRLSLLFSLACEVATDKERKRIVSLWGGSQNRGDELKMIVARLKVKERAHQLMEHHRQESLRLLAEIDNGALSDLMRKLICRIVKAP